MIHGAGTLGPLGSGGSLVPAGEKTHDLHWKLRCIQFNSDIRVKVRNRIAPFTDWITRRPATGDRIVGTVLGQIEPAVGIEEHPGISEIGERRRGLKSIAVGVIAKGWRATGESGGLRGCGWLFRQETIVHCTPLPEATAVMSRHGHHCYCAL